MVFAALAIALAAPAARAQDAEQEQSGAEYANQALALVKKGQFEDARVLYQQAYRSTQSAPIVFNLALAELSSGHGHEVDALMHFRAYLEDPDAEPQKVSIIKSDLLPRAYRMTGHVAVELPPDTVELSVDDVVIPATDGTINTSPGKHALLAETRTAKWRAQVEVAAGELDTAHFEQDPAPPAPIPVRLPQQTATHVRPVGGPEPSRSHAREVVGLSLFGVAALAELAIIPFAIDASNTTSAADLRRDNVMFPTLLISGGVLAAAGAAVFLFVSDPKPNAEKQAGVTVSPTFDPISRSAGLVGRF